MANRSIRKALSIKSDVNIKSYKGARFQGLNDKYLMDKSDER